MHAIALLLACLSWARHGRWLPSRSFHTHASRGTCCFDADCMILQRRNDVESIFVSSAALRHPHSQRPLRALTMFFIALGNPLAGWLHTGNLATGRVSSGKTSSGNQHRMHLGIPLAFQCRPCECMSARLSEAFMQGSDVAKASSLQTHSLPRSMGSFAGWIYKLPRTAGDCGDIFVRNGTGFQYINVDAEDSFHSMVYYAIDPSDRRTGRTAERLHGSYKALKEQDPVVTDIADMERSLAVELKTKIEVLIGPVYSPDVDSDPLRLPIGFFKIIIAPAEMAVAGTFFDGRGILTLLEGLPGIGAQAGSKDRNVSMPREARLTINELFSPAPDFDNYDVCASSALGQRLRDIAEGKQRDDLTLTEFDLTPNGVVDVYRKADILVPRRQFELLDPRPASDLHTRRVYNVVADTIFQRARSEVEPYILNKEEPPMDLVKKYTSLRDTNKRCALSLTTNESKIAIAMRNKMKYGQADGPGVNYTSLAETKGRMNAIIGSFKTAGKDLMLWGNKAQEILETWEWMSDLVPSPWQITSDMVEAYQESQTLRVFGRGDGGVDRARRTRNPIAGKSKDGDGNSDDYAI